MSTAELARSWAQRFIQECPCTLQHLRPWSALNPSDADAIATAFAVRPDETPLLHLKDRGGRGVVLTDQRVMWWIGSARGEASLELVSQARYQTGWFKKRLWLERTELRLRSARRSDLEVLCALLQRIMRERDGGAVTSAGPRPLARGVEGALLASVLIFKVGVAAALVSLPCVGFWMFTQSHYDAHQAREEGKKAARVQKRAERGEEAKATLKRAKETQDPVAAWQLANKARGQFQELKDEASEDARATVELANAKAALSAQLLLDRARGERAEGRLGKARTLLNDAWRARAQAAKAGLETVTEEAMRKEFGQTELEWGRREVKRIEALLARYEWRKVREGSQWLKVSLSRALDRVDLAELRELMKRAEALRGEALENLEPSPALRGPRPKLGQRSEVVAAEAELLRRYPDLVPKGWSGPVTRGAHWVVDIELGPKGRDADGELAIRLWLQHDQVKFVRTLAPKEYGAFPR